MKRLPGLTVCLLAFVVSGFAANVTVDPNGYAGKWRIVGQTGYESGILSVPLAAGTYSMQLDYGTAGYFGFAVDGAGLVTMSAGSEDNAVGGSESLTFNTYSIQFDANGYPGAWEIMRVTSYNYGNGAVTLPIGTWRNRLAVSEFYYFDVAAGGVVTLGAGDEDHGTGGVNLLTFSTFPVYFNVGGFLGLWEIYTVSGGYFTGDRVLTMTPGVFRYRSAVSGYVYFTIDGTGEVTLNAGYEDYAIGGDKLLWFETYNVDVDAGGWPLPYWLYAVSPYLVGNHQVVFPLSPGTYRLYDLFILNYVAGDVSWTFMLDGGVPTIDPTSVHVEAEHASYPGVEADFTFAPVLLDPLTCAELQSNVIAEICALFAGGPPNSWQELEELSTLVLAEQLIGQSVTDVSKPLCAAQIMETIIP